MWFHSLLASWKSGRSCGRRPQRRPACRSTRLCLEHLEDRSLPSAYTANTTTDLINDINAANAAGGANTITLAVTVAHNHRLSVPYVLTTWNNITNGANGLPVIAANDNLTIVGNGDTIERSTASYTPDFRLLAVAGGGSLTMQNLTLEGGYAAGNTSDSGGGAIFNMGTLVLDGVTVQNNGALIDGGGLYAYGGTVTVTNATLDNNNAVFGGGIYVLGGTVSLANDTVASNKAGAGGGLYVQSGTVTLSYDIVNSNSVRSHGGGLYYAPVPSYGGGLYVQSGTVTLANDTVESNASTDYGGGLYIIATNVTLSYDTVESNSAGSGGGLYVLGGTVSLSNDTVASNTAGAGGGLYVNQGTVTLANDTVESNTATGYGGGIYISGFGPAVYLDSFTVANTINNTDNSGLNGSTANIDGPFTNYVQTETSIRVSPAVTSLDWGVTQQFSAIALDQYGEPMATQPALTWTVAAGGASGPVSTGGLYTAPFVNGSDTVVATDAGINLSGTAAVTVTLTPPTVSVPATADPSPVTGTKTNLSVAGYDPGDSSLLYTWAVTSAPAGAPTPTFSSNGSTAAHNTTATFYLAGIYTFQATISDPSGLTAVSSVTVTVVQTPTSLSVTPANVTLVHGATQQFMATAYDQFGQALAAQPTFTWEVSTGGGTISSTGRYTAPKKGTGTFQVTVSADGLTAQANVTVAA